MPNNTPATVMSALALVVALGGAGYAAVSVGSAEIKNNSVASKDIKNRTIATKDLNPKVTKAGGALTGKYPNPGLAADSSPIDVAASPGNGNDPCDIPANTLVLCGTSPSNQWYSGGYGVGDLQVWKDRRGYVHIRGSVEKPALAPDTIFRLPAGMRPTRVTGFQVGIGASAGNGAGGTALLLIYPDGPASGLLELVQESGSYDVAHFGEVVFRVDK